jgi:hypothetical protein
MGPVRTQRCPVRLHALRSHARAPGGVLSLRQQTRPAAFLRRFSPLLEAEYLSDVARCRFKGTLGNWLRNDDGA